jgi:hypothetical protein
MPIQSSCLSFRQEAHPRPFFISSFDPSNPDRSAFSRPVRQGFSPPAGPLELGCINADRCEISGWNSADINTEGTLVAPRKTGTITLIATGGASKSHWRRCRVFSNLLSMSRMARSSFGFGIIFPVGGFCFRIRRWKCHIAP